MPAAEIDPSTYGLARRALLITSALSFAGSVLGIAGISQGVVSGLAIPLVISCVLVSGAIFTTLLARAGMQVQIVATVATIYYLSYLAAGALIAIYASGQQHANLIVFLLWFFPLLLFNKLVNAPEVGRWLAKTVTAVPIAIVALSLRRLISILPIELVFVVVAFCMSYAAFAFTIDIVTRYREEFVAERERAESLRGKAAVLESISDCFISLDAAFALTYLNDSAGREFGVDRAEALGRPLLDVVRGVFSDSVLAAVHAAARSSSASVFEVESREHGRWYEMRCFPRADGLSIYFRNITAQRAAYAKIQHLAFYDALTDLPNRMLLRERLQALLTAPVGLDSLGALLFVDLDDFKTLNDTLGHAVGDRFLQDVATRLCACVRLNDTVARFGGDEFVVLLQGIGEDERLAADNARSIAAKILAELRRPYRFDAIERSSTACIGLTLFSHPYAVDDLLKRADLAMYQAKARGPGSICLYDPVMQTLVDFRAEMQADLRRAIVRDEFILHYQPIVDRGGVTIGAEALLRWIHPRRGMVPPAEFIPLAEEAGLIGELGRWVLATVCRQLAWWSHDARLAHVTIAVNVSMRQFRAPDFAAVVLDVVRATGADPRRLKLELTESSAMENVDDTIAKMTELRAHGIGFAIDDFGTGYSSLSHLKRLPLDQLKIDRTFVADVLTDGKDASIVRTLIALGRNLDLTIVAEGVETAGQRAFLEFEGCSVYQGYLYSRPLPFEAFEAFVAAQSNALPSDRRSAALAPP